MRLALGAGLWLPRAVARELPVQAANLGPAANRWAPASWLKSILSYSIGQWRCSFSFFLSLLSLSPFTENWFCLFVVKKLFVIVRVRVATLTYFPTVWGDIVLCLKLILFYILQIISFSLVLGLSLVPSLPPSLLFSYNAQLGIYFRDSNISRVITLRQLRRMRGVWERGPGVSLHKWLKIPFVLSINFLCCI